MPMPKLKLTSAEMVADARARIEVETDLIAMLDDPDLVVVDIGIFKAAKRLYSEAFMPRAG